MLEEVNLSNDHRAEIIPLRDPKRWRKDYLGFPVFKHLRGCPGPLCYEFDHIFPYSKGGQPTLENCQILSTKCNRKKSNKINLIAGELRESCFLGNVSG